MPLGTLREILIVERYSNNNGGIKLRKAHQPIGIANDEYSAKKQQARSKNLQA